MASDHHPLWLRLIVTIPIAAILVLLVAASGGPFYLTAGFGALVVAIAIWHATRVKTVGQLFEIFKGL
jgi:hypothetical protein